MIAVDYIFGTTFPCLFCGEETAYGLVLDIPLKMDTRWVSVCKECSITRTQDETIEKLNEMRDLYA